MSMQKYKILLVDDSSFTLKALQRVFKPEGYIIYMATSAKEALAILGQKEIDLIISDENMPGGSGTDLLKSVRELYPDVIRMMLTGLTDIEVAKKAINNGEIYKFFSKPWDEFELISSVRYALQYKIIEKENRHLKSVCKNQQELLAQLEREHPGIADRNIAPDGSLIIEG